MTQKQILELLFYLAADSGASISDDKVKVWYDQFQHLDYQIGITAARLMLSRPSRGFPRVSEFHEVVNEILSSADELIPWPEAWEQWITIARRTGYTRREEAMLQFSQVNQLGARALGTMAGEYFMAQDEDVKILRAQFRMRYESLLAFQKKDRSLNPEIKLQVETRRRLAIEEREPEQASQISASVLKRLEGGRK